MQVEDKSTQLWEEALRWVATHKTLIRVIASPYRQHIAGDLDDLHQEAVIAAYKALLEVDRKKTPEEFGQFFYVIFKTSCISMARGTRKIHCLEDYFLHHRKKEEGKAIPREPSMAEIRKAFRVMSERQREICIWLLRQPTPANTRDLAQHFQFSRRQACRLINFSISRIEKASL